MLLQHSYKSSPVVQDQPLLSQALKAIIDCITGTIHLLSAVVNKTEDSLFALLVGFVLVGIS